MEQAQLICGSLLYRCQLAINKKMYRSRGSKGVCVARWLAPKNKSSLKQSKPQGSYRQKFGHAQRSRCRMMTKAGVHRYLGQHTSTHRASPPSHLISPSSHLEKKRPSLPYLTLGDGSWSMLYGGHIGLHSPTTALSRHCPFYRSTNPGWSS